MIGKVLHFSAFSLVYDLHSRLLIGLMASTGQKQKLKLSITFFLAENPWI